MLERRSPREQLDPPYDIKLVFVQKITSVLRKINKNCKRAYFKLRLEIFSPNLVYKISEFQNLSDALLLVKFNTEKTAIFVKKNCRTYLWNGL